MCEYVEWTVLVLMQVRLMDQRHTGVNNSVGVRAGRLPPRYKLIYVGVCSDRGRDGGRDQRGGYTEGWRGD